MTQFKPPQAIGLFIPIILFQCVMVPVVEESAPDESCFDVLVESMKNEPASTQCVFSCQMGRGRTTLGIQNINAQYIDKQYI